jgi:hypothetical protein
MNGTCQEREVREDSGVWRTHLHETLVEVLVGEVVERLLEQCVLRVPDEREEFPERDLRSIDHAPIRISAGDGRGIVIGILQCGEEGLRFGSSDDLK